MLNNFSYCNFASDLKTRNYHRSLLSFYRELNFKLLIKNQKQWKEQKSF